MIFSRQFRGLDSTIFKKRPRAVVGQLYKCCLVTTMDWSFTVEKCRRRWLREQGGGSEAKNWVRTGGMVTASLKRHTQCSESLGFGPTDHLQGCHCKSLQWRSVGRRIHNVCTLRSGLLCLDRGLPGTAPAPPEDLTRHNFHFSQKGFDTAYFSPIRRVYNICG